MTTTTATYEDSTKSRTESEWTISSWSPSRPIMSDSTPPPCRRGRGGACADLAIASQPNPAAVLCCPSAPSFITVTQTFIISFAVPCVRPIRCPVLPLAKPSLMLSCHGETKLYMERATDKPRTACRIAKIKIISTQPEAKNLSRPGGESIPTMRVSPC